VNVARRGLVSVALAALAACSPGAPDPEGRSRGDVLPGKGVRFVAIGDFGTGSDDQSAVAAAMCELLEREPFRYVVTTGDNIYESGAPRDFEAKFFSPYACLLSEGVRFRAALGNHDLMNNYKEFELRKPVFGMPARFYAWRLGAVSFVTLDSNTLIADGRYDIDQVRWLNRALERVRGEPWTIVVAHHPVYSGGGRHGPTPGFDELLGRTFSKLGVDLMLAGHDHVYSRARVDDVTYVVTGGGGAPLAWCVTPLPSPVRRCEAEHHFVEVEATRHRMTLSAIDQSGNLLDRTEVTSNE
jgi:3',5'-cyclic AMP phosphodiesterase CpdA